MSDKHVTFQVVEKDAETERKRAIIEAEKEALVAKIQYEQKIMEKESLQRIAQIEDEMHLARQKSHADAEFYKHSQQAEVNKMLYTPQFLELKKYESLAANSKVYFGQNIPQTFITSGCVGDTATSILNDNSRNSEVWSLFIVIFGTDKRTRKSRNNIKLFRCFLKLTTLATESRQ